VSIASAPSPTKQFDGNALAVHDRFAASKSRVKNSRSRATDAGSVEPDVPANPTRSGGDVAGLHRFRSPCPTLIWRFSRTRGSRAANVVPAFLAQKGDLAGESCARSIAMLANDVAGMMRCPNSLGTTSIEKNIGLGKSKALGFDASRGLPCPRVAAVACRCGKPQFGPVSHVERIDQLMTPPEAIRRAGHHAADKRDIPCKLNDNEPQYVRVCHTCENDRRAARSTGPRRRTKPQSDRPTVIPNLVRRWWDRRPGSTLAVVLFGDHRKTLRQDSDHRVVPIGSAALSAIARRGDQAVDGGASCRKANPGGTLVGVVWTAADDDDTSIVRREPSGPDAGRWFLPTPSARV